MIELSVGLPVFKSSAIVWLAMESLCNQVNINFKWELIICEELCPDSEDGYCGNQFFDSYRDRLYKAGCREIKFIDLEDYVTLESKWKFIVQSADKKSEMLLLQASDNYSQNDRISTAYNHIKGGYDWIHYENIYFYNCKTGQIILRSHIPSKKSKSFSSKGVNISIRMELIKNLPFRDKGFTIDGWLYRNARSVKYDIFRSDMNTIWNGGNWETGINTDGFNKISLKRVRHYQNPQPPFYKTDKVIGDIVPEYIADRLLGLSKDVFDKKII